MDAAQHRRICFPLQTARVWGTPNPGRKGTRTRIARIIATQGVLVLVGGTGVRVDLGGVFVGGTRVFVG